MLDGKNLAAEIQSEIKKEIFQKKLRPGLAVILIGSDPASNLYVSKKKQAAQDVGIEFHEYLLEEDVSQEEVLECINFLNNDDKTNAILVQLPLPKHLDTDKIIRAIDPKKDVDGFHPENIKDFLQDKAIITPGLPLGVLRLLEQTGEDLRYKKAVIVSKGKVFSQPMIKILEDREMEVELIKPDDKNLSAKTLEADVLVASCGKAFLIKEDMVKKDAIVIDIGINKIDNDYVVGDVDYSAVFEKVKFITPVPGGVGPMTIAMLLYNTVILAENK